ncbi:DoxX family protein [Dyella sp. C9]|uniref:DoxX family protein n=1 Tax=Dyella sp. C9 TaxID=2202154 RepID=UPI000DEFD641|nr:DoxX family protein [Dyella sp. C9]
MAAVSGQGGFDRLARRFAAPAVMWLALLALCAAYLQGGIQKLLDFPGAVAETAHFGLSPATPVTVVTIVLELGGSLAILLGRGRWLGALLLAGFTLLATFVANRFWDAPPVERFGLTNAFFEHLGLVGGFLLVAWHDLRARGQGTSGSLP